MGEFQRRAAGSDAVAVIDDSGAHTARELFVHAAELAAALEGEGGAGTVLVQADNSWRTVAATVAVGMSGGVLAVVNRHTTGAEFAAAFEDIRPDAVVAEPSALQEWGVPSLPAGGVRRGVLDGWEAWSSDGPREVSRWAGGSLIGLTSGSTGRPKGVVQSEDALRYACSQTIAINGLRQGDAVAALVPLSSTAAYCFGVYLALALGGPLVLWRRWDPAAALARMAEAQVRWSMCVPTMALQLGGAAAGSRVLQGVRSITVGGGPMDVAALGRAEQSLGTRILRVFGMSECLGHTSPLPGEPVEIRLGRDGRPFPGTELRVVDGEGREMPRGEVGRAQVRGPSLFLGYARDGKLEAPELTADGFFPTGDLMTINQDETVSVMGREKDVIIRGGRNIDVTEVERAVASHPSVWQVCVVPVADEILGERVAALVTVVDGGGVGLDDITRHLRSVGLSKTKWPEFVFAVDKLPQTTVGKISRSAAKDLAGDLQARLARLAGKAEA
ncbi:class I adenylate-forming enzyme family protein [Sphaerisporangium perillae]|uniref:class I adenylate-forming enzyme family protein n=1 Tax=Sphaerisporangium perillae TaxID=2935860 RepID=UPI00200FD142|nr:class I adenylate-forming enzyme family protein [Sphaerisporangium perillae]